MPSQEPISPGQIKPESSREPQTSSRLQQTNVNLRLHGKARSATPWMREQIDRKLVEPNSGLGQAIGYMLRHWKPLTLFLRQAGRTPGQQYLLCRARHNRYYAASDPMPRCGLEPSSSFENGRIR